MWTWHIPGGPLFRKHTAHYIGDEIFAFGFEEEVKYPHQIRVFILNTRTFRWRAIMSGTRVVPPLMYGEHTTVAYGTKIYLYHIETLITKFYCFDTKSLKWSKINTSGELPTVREGFSACSIGNKMYLFGGFTDNHEYSNELNCLNLDTYEWKIVNTKGKPPSPRDYCATVAVGDRIYVFGGRGETDSQYHSILDVYLNEIYYFDAITETWATLQPTGKIPKGRRNHCAWFHNYFIYVYGGYDDNTNEYFTGIHRYSIKNNSWERYNAPGNTPSARKSMTCTVCDDQVFVIGGTGPCCGSNAELGIVTEVFNDLNVLDYAPSLQTLGIISILENKLSLKALPHQVRLSIKNMSMPCRTYVFTRSFSAPRESRC